MAADDKQWASKYLLDPLNAPEPSQETGPGTHYSSTFDPSLSHRPAAELSAQNKAPPIHTRNGSSSNHNEYPSPPASASPRRKRVSNNREEAFSTHSDSKSALNRDSQASSQLPTSTEGSSGSTRGLRRNSSLSSRFNGDQSHRPLEMIKRDAKLANRAPHLRKKNHVGPDVIDVLDNIGPGAYHHEGPYDATLTARNNKPTFSPVEAVRSSNEETLKATPKEKIQDSIEKHRPLDGVAMVPSGMTDSMGRKYEYEEGADMMIENGGNYKRWPGVQYHPDDHKGKGEPSYSIERALKEHKDRGRRMADRDTGIEMTPRRTTGSGMEVLIPSNGQRYSDREGSMRRSTSLRRAGGSYRKRVGKAGGEDL